MSKLRYPLKLKSDMGKITIIVSLFFLLFLTTSLKDYIGSRGNIESFYMITTAGVDKGQKTNTVRVTVISKETGSSEEKTETEQPQKYFSAESPSIFELNRLLHTFMAKDVFWGHLDVVLMSQAIAEKNFPAYLDFFIADHETRLDPLLFIVKDRRAEEVIKLVTESGTDVTDLLNNLNKGLGAMSISSEVDLLKASNLILNEYNAPYLPLLELQDETTDITLLEENNDSATTQSNTPTSPRNDASPQNNDSAEQTTRDASKSQIALIGYAFFDSETYELVGFLEDYDARGFNWVTDNIASGPITVKDFDGANITLEIINSKSKIEPKINGNTIHVTLSVSMYSNLLEEQGQANSTNKEGLAHLNRQQKQIIEKEIQSAIDFATKHNLDIFNVSDVIFHKYPKEWDEMKRHWQEKISTIEYTIEVNSSIKRAYMFNSPLTSKSDEEK